MTIVEEEFLAHYGVKGMRWGVRKKSSDGGGSDSGLSRGQKAAARMADNANWKKNVKGVLDDMAEANAEQDVWMRSLGLGAAVNKKDN